MTYRTILLFGAPGAGKGTQGKALGSLPHFFHCACGEVFRSLNPDTALGRLFQEYSRRGQLVPDGPTIELWQNFIEGRIASGRFRPEHDLLLLDGIPRNVPQAVLLQGKIEVRAVFNLRCAPADALIDRLQRRALKENRQDDAQVEVIRQRLEVYEQESQPVLDFYDPKLLHHIDAGQTPAKVLFDILAELVKIQTLESS